jgi:beta-galactosidase
MTLSVIVWQLSLMGAGAQRQQTVLTDGWQFSRDKVTWQSVSIPHDWAISGPFDKQWDLQNVAIAQNGETQASEKSGRSGALPWIGEGHYRRTLTIPEGFSGHAELLFDGAMAEPHVIVNGQEAGYWPYGYNAFRVDITPFIQSGDNQLEVDLTNQEESSRWYPGAGLYRPVTLILTGDARIDDWGITTETTMLNRSPRDIVQLKVQVPVVNHQPGMTIGVALLDADGTVLSNLLPAPMRDGTAGATFNVTAANARMWSPESPYLYKLRITLHKAGDYDPSVYAAPIGDVIDEKTINVGLRTVKVSAQGGFQLNGVTRKIRGVCLHHDEGPLGAAENKAAFIRQIQIMKEMGADAIRTAHNMPSQMQMDVCDSLGMMVMAESFDMWLYPKCRNGYARFFSEWADRDITNLVVAHRNHPCIIMWSIGNEIPEQWSKEGTEIAAHLQNLCHRLDPTRPVTQGMDRAEAALGSGFAQVMDVPGFNYRVHKYQNNLRLLPQGFLLGSETASTVSSRGVYKFPVEPNDNSRFASYSPNYDPTAIQTADGQCSSYDVEYCPWSNLPDDDWCWQDDYPWVIGEFVWTGFDYLGEPSPYDEYWPSRSSYFGICDLAGLPKDRYFLYRSHWQKEGHTLHLLPHWTWSGPACPDSLNRTGQVTPVYCYTDYPEAELLVNGRSQGRIRKNSAERLDRYRLRWNDVVYEPGELKVVAYDSLGQVAGTHTVRTAGQPARLQLSAWTQASPTLPSLRADGQDLAFITVSLTDRQGNLIPAASDQLSFQVSGAGTFKATCNGDATSLEPFTQPTMRLFNGQLVVVVQAARQRGTVTLTVTDPERRLRQTIRIPVIPVS